DNKIGLDALHVRRNDDGEVERRVDWSVRRAGRTARHHSDHQHESAPHHQILLERNRMPDALLRDRGPRAGATPTCCTDFYSRHPSTREASRETQANLSLTNFWASEGATMGGC